MYLRPITGVLLAIAVFVSGCFELPESRPDTGFECAGQLNGMPCSDGNLCNGMETCQEGLCTAGKALKCDDENECTTSSCDAKNGCEHNAAEDGTECSGTDICIRERTCLSGACSGGTALPCDDEDPCTTDSCDKEKGCVYESLADGERCDDDNLCNGLETCSNGKCQAGAPLKCDDNEVCTTDSCDKETGCVFTANTEDCTDENACTETGKCADKGCKPGNAIECEDGNECTDNSCDAKDGCVFTANTEDCTDGDACTENDVCADKGCKPGDAIECEDGNKCTDHSCDKDKGCVNVAKKCEDDNECTEDSCDKDEGCINAAKTCDDSNECTNDSCDKDKGCVYVAAGKTCDDGDACTTEDACVNKACIGGSAPDCNDGLLCTKDSCNKGTGCVNAPNDAACSPSECAKTSVCDPTKQASHKKTGCYEEKITPCTNPICKVWGEKGDSFVCPLNLSFFQTSQGTPGVECSGDDACNDFSDCTIDWCQDKECKHLELATALQFTLNYNHEQLTMGDMEMEFCPTPDNCISTPATTTASGHNILVDPDITEWNGAGNVKIIKSQSTKPITKAEFKFEVSKDAAVVNLTGSFETSVPQDNPALVEVDTVVGASKCGNKLPGGAVNLQVITCPPPDPTIVCDPKLCKDGEKSYLVTTNLQCETHVPCPCEIPAPVCDGPVPPDDGGKLLGPWYGLGPYTGDLNGDGDLNVSDSLALLHCINLSNGVGIPSQQCTDHLKLEWNPFFDLNCDGSVDMADYTRHQHILFYELQCAGSGGIETCALPTPAPDDDGDLVHDNCEPEADQDGDNVPDSCDNCPGSTGLDTDHDGCENDQDSDDDSDGFSDACELSVVPPTDPLNPKDSPTAEQTAGKPCP